MKHLHALSLAGILALSGCVTLEPGQLANLCISIDNALTEAPESLRQAADAGDGHAQLSYSIVLQYGLNGAARNFILASQYHAKAIASRGTTTTAIYVPGYLKTPGHTQLVTIPQYDVSGTEDAVVGQCLTLLSSDLVIPDSDPRLVRGACGGPENYHRLGALWANARPQT